MSRSIWSIHFSKETNLIGLGGERKSALFFEDIAVPGNGANQVSINSLLKKTPTKNFVFLGNFL